MTETLHHPTSHGLADDDLVRDRTEGQYVSVFQALLADDPLAIDVRAVAAAQVAHHQAGRIGEQLAVSPAYEMRLGSQLAVQRSPHHERQVGNGGLDLAKRSAELD